MLMGITLINAYFTDLDCMLKDQEVRQGLALDLKAN
jgi:hypothetical protein